MSSGDHTTRSSDRALSAALEVEAETLASLRRSCASFQLVADEVRVVGRGWDGCGWFIQIVHMPTRIGVQGQTQPGRWSKRQAAPLREALRVRLVAELTLAVAQHLKRAGLGVPPKKRLHPTPPGRRRRAPTG